MSGSNNENRARTLQAPADRAAHGLARCRRETGEPSAVTRGPTPASVHHPHPCQSESPVSVKPSAPAVGNGFHRGAVHPLTR